MSDTSAESKAGKTSSAPKMAIKLNREFGAALSASLLNNLSAARRLAAHKKTVSFRALSFFGFICD